MSPGQARITPWEVVKDSGPSGLLSLVSGFYLLFLICFPGRKKGRS